MIIAAYGDSWTKGFDLTLSEQCWPEHLANNLNCNLFKDANCGADNQSILERFKKTVQKIKPDIAIIGWSGITRIRHQRWPTYKQYSLSWVPDEHCSAREKYFRSHNLTDLTSAWIKQIDQAEEICKQINCKLINFSVFGDQHAVDDSRILDCSALEYIASCQGPTFKYNIPIFEFDFLHENNDVTYNFAKNNFKKDWMKACVEREDLRDTKLFFNCGHPNEAGYIKWAKYLQGII